MRYFIFICCSPLMAMESTSPTRPLAITTEHSLVTPRSSPHNKSALLEKDEKTIMKKEDICAVLSSHGMTFIEQEAHCLLSQMPYPLGCNEINRDLDERKHKIQRQLDQIKELPKSDETELDDIYYTMDLLIISHAHAKNYLAHLKNKSLIPSTKTKD